MKMLIPAALVLVLLAHPVLADFGVSYDHYIYAKCSGDDTAIAADEVLTGQTHIYQSFTKDGDPDLGNYATVSYFADLRNGWVGSNAYALGVENPDYPYWCHSTGRVNNIRFWDNLTFTIPAGYYPDGVSIGLSGYFGGVISSIVGAGAQADVWVSLASSTFSTSLQTVGTDEEGSYVFDEDIELSYVILAPGSTINSSRQYTYQVSAAITSCHTWSVSYNPGTGYVTGWGQNELYNGLRILSINVTEGSGVTWISESGVFLQRATSTPDHGTSSAVVRLRQNYPNPFNPRTTIAFDLPDMRPVTLQVFAVDGRLVQTLIDGETRNMGKHETVWNGRNDAGLLMPTGVYFYRLAAGDLRQSQRMILLK